MKTEYSFPAGIDFLLDAIFNHHKVPFKKLATTNGVTYTAGTETVRYARTIERDIGMMRIPFDRLTPGGMILLQFRVTPDRDEVKTRYIQVEDGVMIEKPKGAFKKIVNGISKLTRAGVEIGPPFKSTPGDYEAETLFESLVVGALFCKDAPYLALVEDVIESKGITLSEERLLKLGQRAAIKGRVRKWLAKDDQE